MFRTFIVGQMMSVLAYAESPPTPLGKALFLLIKAGNTSKCTWHSPVYILL